MHQLMREHERRCRPFCIENPQLSKLWLHPLIMKWTRHEDTRKVEFDYCQFGMPWRKATSVLAYGNAKFNHNIRCKCDTTFKGKQSICSRTRSPHELLTGFTGGKTKGQYKITQKSSLTSSLLASHPPHTTAVVPPAGAALTAVSHHAHHHLQPK